MKTVTNFSILQIPSKTPGQIGDPLLILEEDLNFSVDQSLLLDVGGAQNRSNDIYVEAIQVDNTNNPNVLAIQYGDVLAMQIQVPASVVSVYSVPRQKNPKVLFTNPVASGTANVFLYGYNFVGSASQTLSGSGAQLAQIATNTGTTSTNTGNIETHQASIDSSLIAIKSQGATLIAVNDGSQGHDNTILPALVSNSYQLYRVQLAMPNNTVQTTAGENYFELHWNSSLWVSKGVYIPSSAPNATAGNNIFLDFDMSPLGINMGINTALNIHPVTAVSTASVQWLVSYRVI